MKIIKIGNYKKLSEYRKECGYCGTEFIYEHHDIQPDFRDDNYVICPICNHFLTHGESPQSVDRSKDC